MCRLVTVGSLDSADGRLPSASDRPVRLGILTSGDSLYTRDIERAAGLLCPAPSVRQIRFADLQIGLGTTPWQQPGADLDVAIIRSMPLGSLEQVIFRMDCLRDWQDKGVKLINPPQSLETAIDKWLTLQRLAAAGIAVPPTIACQNREVAMQACEALGGDVLVKPLFGGEGRGIIRVQSTEMAWRVFGSLQQIGQVLYVQQFVEHLGYDIRVLLVGQDSFSIRRRSNGGWLTNLSQGSVAEAHRLSPQELDLARRSAEVVGGSVLGVDLLPTTDGRLLVLEVNAVPGWRGTAKALDVDIARKVVEHACGQVAQQ